MNEITLSGDLNIITTEIIQYGTTINISYWEVGRRLRHVKDNDLTHGNFMNYLERIGIAYTDANRLMKISELPNVASLQTLPKTNLFLISSLPEEERTKEHTTEKGETKKPDEMTVKELQQLNKRVKLQTDIINQKNDTINKQAEEVRKLRQQEPQVVTKTVEKFPEDYEKIKQENEQLKQSNQKLQRDLKWVRDDLSLTQTQYNLLENSTAEAKELERKIQSLQSQEKTIVEKMEAVETFYELESNFNDFFDTKMAPMRFKGVADHLYATNAVDRIRSMITQAELWAEEMNKILPNKNMKILEGEIIND